MLSTSDLIDMTIAFHRDAGRPDDCAYVAWLESKRAGTPQQLIREGLLHSNWHPRFCIDGIVICDKAFGATTMRDDCIAVHLDYLGSLDINKSRQILEDILRNHFDKLSNFNRAKLMDIFAAKHPNPRACFLIPEIFDNLSTSLRSKIDDMRTM